MRLDMILLMLIRVVVTIKLKDGSCILMILILRLLIIC